MSLQRHLYIYDKYEQEASHVFHLRAQVHPFAKIRFVSRRDFLDFFDPVYVPLAEQYLQLLELNLEIGELAKRAKLLEEAAKEDMARRQKELDAEYGPAVHKAELEKMRFDLSEGPLLMRWLHYYEETVIQIEEWLRQHPEPHQQETLKTLRGRLIERERHFQKRIEDHWDLDRAVRQQEERIMKERYIERTHAVLQFIKWDVNIEDRKKSVCVLVYDE